MTAGGTLDTNIASLLEALSDDCGSAVAVMQGTVSRSWTEFDQRAARLAAAMQTIGVGPGDRVAIALFNCPEYLEIVYATLKLKAVPVNVNYRYRAAELAYLLSDSSARIVFFHQALSVEVALGVAGLNRELITVCVAEPVLGSDEPQPEYERLIEAAEPAPRVARSGSDELIIYTGGTTGKPKGVVWEHRELLLVLSSLSWERAGLTRPAGLAEVVAAARTLRARGDTPTVVPLPPLIHSTGLFETLASLLQGGTAVLCASRSFDADEVLGLVQEHRVQQLSIVGDAFGRPLLAAAERAEAAGRRYDLQSLRRITSAGMSWSSANKANLSKYWSAGMYDVIASTEGGPYAIGATLPGESPQALRFWLTPVARVVDDDWRDVQPGSPEPGRLVARGALPSRYLNDPQRSARTWITVDGERYVLSGDLAMREPDGSVRLLGRGSEVINTGGEKVFVEEIEQAIAGYPGIEDVVVSSVPDDRLGNRIVAVVQLEQAGSVTVEEIRSYAGQQLAGYKCPRQVVLVDRIERTAAGKLNRGWARQLAADAAG